MTESVEIGELALRFDDESMLTQYCALNMSKTSRQRLECTRDGQIDCFVVWFELALDDEIAICNAPSALCRPPVDSEAASCWHQTVYASRPNSVVQRGHTLDVDVVMRKDCIRVVQVDTPAQPNFGRSDEVVLSLSRPEIALLNTAAYQQAMCDQFDLWAQNAGDGSRIRIGLMTSTFSWLLFRLINDYGGGHEESTGRIVEWELFVGSDEADERFRRNVEQAAWNIQITRISQLREDMLEKRGRRPCLDKLFVEPIDASLGSLKPHVLADLLFVRDFNSKKRTVSFTYFDTYT